MPQIFTRNQLLEKELNSIDFYSMKIMGLLTYAENKDLYYVLINDYLNAINKLAHVYFIWRKKLFINIANKNSLFEALDNRLISRLLNKAYQEGIITMVPCISSITKKLYYSFTAISNYNKFISILNKIKNELSIRERLNAFDYSKSVFNYSKGSVYWIKSIFDHLVFIGLAYHIDEININLSYKEEWIRCIPLYIQKML